MQWNQQKITQKNVNMSHALFRNCGDTEHENPKFKIQNIDFNSLFIYLNVLGQT